MIELNCDFNLLLKAFSTTVCIYMYTSIYDCLQDI